MQPHRKDPMYPLFLWLKDGEWRLPRCYQLKRFKLADHILTACIRRSKRRFA